MTGPRLDGQVVLVTGVTGNVGWGIAHAAVDAGAQVIAPVRSPDAVDSVAAELPSVTVVSTDYGADDLDRRISEVIEPYGRLDHVVAPMGAWWQGGATLDQPSSTLTELLDTYVVAQHRLLRATAPHLRRVSGSYTIITGAGGEADELPGSGLLLVALRAQLALSDDLRRELRSDAVRVNEFRIATRVERAPRHGVVPSTTAGTAAVSLLASDRRSEVVRYPG